MDSKYLSPRRLGKVAALAFASALSACSQAPPISAPLPTDVAQQAFANACEPWDDWSKPAPPFRIFGNSWHVGTCGISAILITTENGHALIDSGTRGAGPLVAANIKALGFDPADIAILLFSHEHYDHVGAAAYLQHISEARLLSSPGGAQAMATGISQPGDPQHAYDERFDPVRVAGTVSDFDPVSIGTITLMPVLTPGHTPGSMSWFWWSCERTDCKAIVYADSMSAVSHDDYRFVEKPAYLRQFEASLAKIAALPCDILLTPHPSSSRMIGRIKTGTGLVDSSGCATYADRAARRLDVRLQKERVEQ